MTRIPPPPSPGGRRLPEGMDPELFNKVWMAIADWTDNEEAKIDDLVAKLYELFNERG